MLTASGGAVAQRFRHSAVFYGDLGELVDEVSPFILEGLEAGEPVLVAELPEKVRALKDALGADADRVTFRDMAAVGKNPACIIPVWREFVSRHPDTAVRGVGEPAWSGRRSVELEECWLHESLLNVAFDTGPEFRLLCPYDASLLPDDVLAGAMTTHPDIGSEPRHERYGGHEQAHAEFERKLPDPTGTVDEIPFGPYDLAGVRGIVRRLAQGARLSVDAADDLVLAVHELASNSVEHGGGEGRLRSWSGPESLVLEVSDAGVIDDPLVGRELALALSESGRGIWIANQLCDLVQVRSSQAGTTIRLHAWT